MPWTWALRQMPWKTLLVHAPTLVNAARHLYATSRTPAAGPAPSARAGDTVERLSRAIDELEAREAQQAALVADLAKQIQTMTTALEVLGARVQFALIGAAVALVVALAAVAMLVWR